MSESNSLQSAETAPILPRSAWSSQLTWLKITMKAKQALDRQEKAFFSAPKP